MSVTISKENNIDIEDIINLYVDAGWGNKDSYSDKSIAMYKNAFKNSSIYSAYYNEKLVGFIRFLSDEYSTTYILEFLCHSNFQKKGIGSKLLNTLKETHGHTTIYTDSVEEFSSFYLNRGFKKHKLLGISCKSNSN